MSPTALVIYVLLSIDPASGKMTVGVRPMTAAACAARLAELRQDKPPGIIGFCAEPGQGFEFMPDYKGS